jgi:hypothetical protein
MVEEEIPPSRQVTTSLTAMALVDADLDAMDAVYADMTKELPSPTPIRFAEEHLQLIFELWKKMDDQVHI